MSKTYKDLRDFDNKRNKEYSRRTFKDVDMRVRVKPVEYKEKGGSKNWRNELDKWLIEDDVDGSDDNKKD